MQIVAKHTARAATPQEPRPAAPDAPQPMTKAAAAAVAGGLNPQPLPPYHEPELEA